MRITPNWSEKPESGPIAAGVYKARVEKHEAKESKAGVPMGAWTLRIYGGEGDAARYNNWPVQITTMYAGKGVGITERFLKTCLGKTATLESFDTDQLIGKQLEIQIKDRFQDDGTVSNYPDVKPLRPID